jgi:TP901 family phage tail tape measure protein
MASSFLGLAFEISSDPSKAIRGLEQLHSSTGNIMGQIKQHFVITAGDIWNMGKRIEELAGKTARLGEEFLHVSEKTGLSVEQVSALRFVTEQTGTSLDSVARALGLLSKGTSDFAKDSSPANKALQELGISLTTPGGTRKPMHEMLLEIADAFQKMPDGAQKSADAMALFGRGGLAMIPFLNQGRAGIERLEAQAAKLGVTMTEKDAKAAQDFERQTRALSAEIDGLEFKIGRKLIPGLNIMVGALVGDANATLAFKGAVAQAGDELTHFLDKGSNLASKWMQWFYPPAMVIQQYRNLRQALDDAGHGIHGSGLADLIDQYMVPAFQRMSAAQSDVIAKSEDMARSMANEIGVFVGAIAGRKAQAEVEGGFYLAEGAFDLARSIWPPNPALIARGLGEIGAGINMLKVAGRSGSAPSGGGGGGASEYGGRDWGHEGGYGAPGRWPYPPQTPAYSGPGAAGSRFGQVHVVVIGENEKAKWFAQNVNAAVEAGHFVMSTASQRGAPVGH